MENTRSVGRPRLADAKLKKQSLIIVGVCFIIITVLLFIGMYKLNVIRFGRMHASIAYSNLKQKSAGKCPSPPTYELEGDTNISIRLNITDLTASDLNNLYVVTKTYDDSKHDWKDPKVYLVKNYLTKEESKIYTKTLSIGNYYAISIYSGKKTCARTIFVKDGYTINDRHRGYKFIEYAVLTKKGIIKASASNVDIKSSDSKIISVSSKEQTCKATSQTAKSSGKEDQSAKITIKNGNITGSFNIKLPSNYPTGYLQHPLYEKSKGEKKSLGVSTNYSKAPNTKNSDGKLYGVELSAKEGSKVYAMDSGTVYKVRTKTTKDDTYGYLIIIKSTVNKVTYYHTYAHLKDVKVKKNQKIYKGQVIGTVGKSAKSGKNLKKPILYIALSAKIDGTYYGVAINNFVGRNLSYGNVTKKTANDYQKYIKDNMLAEKNTFCVMSSDMKNGNQIALNYNYGTGTNKIDYVEKTDKLDKYPKEERKGYLFDGWYTSATGGTKVTDLKTLTSKSTILYAHWNAKTVNITLNANGGEFKNGNDEYKTSAKYNSYVLLNKMTTPQMEDYDFAGWYNEEGYPEDNKMLVDTEKDIVLDADWQQYGSNVYFLQTYASGESILFQSGDNEFALLDTGKYGKKKKCPIIKNQIKKIIPKKNKVHNIKYIFISHWHNDHYGCLNSIVNDKDIKIGDGSKESGIYIKYSSTASKKMKETIKKLVKAGYNVHNYDGSLYTESNLKNYDRDIKDSGFELSLGNSTASAINIHFFNTSDVFKGEKSCNEKKSKVKKYYASKVRVDDDTGEKFYPSKLADGKTVSAIDFETNKIINMKKINIKNINDSKTYGNYKPYKYYYEYNNSRKEKCSENTQSVALLLEIPTTKGKRYVYLPSDLENNGISVTGEKITFGDGTSEKVYGPGVSYFDDEKNVIKAKESITARKVKEYICGSVNNNCSELNNIVLYQASHHGYNNDKYAIDLLGLNNNNVYVVAPRENCIANSKSYLSNRTFYQTLNKVALSNHFTVSNEAGAGQTGKVHNKSVAFKISEDGTIKPIKKTKLITGVKDGECVFKKVGD